MPISNTILKNDVRVYFEKNINTNSKILDVGAGVGTYSKLLRDLGYKMDCIEVWLPYVTQYKLNELYDNVIIGNIMNYNMRNYDVIIMGDVLEHLSIDDSLKLMDSIESNNQVCLVAVPYLHEQGEYYGNKYEIHKQSDLTNEIVLNRYKNLRLLFKSDCYQYGYYINRDGHYNNDMQSYVDSEIAVSNRLLIDKIENGFIHYLNDGAEKLNIKLDVYSEDNLIYTDNISMESYIGYWSNIFNGGKNKFKYVFSGDRINKVYNY